ncbi:MAG: hypothetical protein ACPG70_07020 [Candidatus Puniceispirillaceae bacterium]|jgi:hypothetical protein
MTLTPKNIYLMIVLLASILLIGDHLTSPALTDVGSPSELGNACAPCGAPCTE